MKSCTTGGRLTDVTNVLQRKGNSIKGDKYCFSSLVVTLSGKIKWQRTKCERSKNESSAFFVNSSFPLFETASMLGARMHRLIGKNQ